MLVFLQWLFVLAFGFALGVMGIFLAMTLLLFPLRYVGSVTYR